MGWVSAGLATALETDDRATTAHKRSRNGQGELVPGRTMEWLRWLLDTGQVGELGDGLSDDAVFHSFVCAEPVVSKGVLFNLCEGL